MNLKDHNPRHWVLPRLFRVAITYITAEDALDDTASTMKSTGILLTIISASTGLGALADIAVRE